MGGKRERERERETEWLERGMREREGMGGERERVHCDACFTI